MLYGQVAVAIENLSTSDWQSYKEHHRKNKVLVNCLLIFSYFFHFFSLFLCKVMKSVF